MFIALLRSLLLNFAIAIILQSFDQIAFADRNLDREKKIAIAIDDQKIADHSYPGICKKLIPVKRFCDLQLNQRSNQNLT